MSKGSLQVLTSIFEVFAYGGAFVGALSGVSYVAANKALQKILRHEADLERQAYEEARHQAQERLANAEVMSREVEQENIKLLIKLEEERTSKLKLEERLAPRRISPEQHAVIVQVLQPYAGNPVIVTKLEDWEAGTYADQIIATLQESGFQVTVNRIGMTSPRYGLFLAGKFGPSLQLVMAAFEKAGIKPSPGDPLQLRSPALNLFVGLKPPN